MQRYSATTQDCPSDVSFYLVQLNRNSLDALASVLCSALPPPVSLSLDSSKLSLLSQFLIQTQPG